jgi:hypothetical protein
MRKHICAAGFFMFTEHKVSNWMASSGLGVPANPKVNARTAAWTLPGRHLDEFELGQICGGCWPSMLQHPAHQIPFLVRQTAIAQIHRAIVRPSSDHGPNDNARTSSRAGVILTIGVTVRQLNSSYRDLGLGAWSPGFDGRESVRVLIGHDADRADSFV